MPFPHSFRNPALPKKITFLYFLIHSPTVFLLIPTKTSYKQFVIIFSYKFYYYLFIIKNTFTKSIEKSLFNNNYHYITVYLDRKVIIKIFIYKSNKNFSHRKQNYISNLNIFMQIEKLEFYKI